ncbi:hypothetical protein QAD02_015745 [Eretmocerus hayati]|uniref:Uncharacterized protein n=1 Tax=Eretmocerus hayati TaxID=131215 RepID=A0ACC2P957_9HYME|nr:hypothetical protein QAD02_015745 [Eretmocerus hayati]
MNIQDVDQHQDKLENEKKLTPLQGKGRFYGFFTCIKCGRYWESGNSWANSGQECETCRINIYPYKQGPLKKPGLFDYYNPAGVHDQGRCEKCKQLGRNCRSGRR